MPSAKAALRDATFVGTRAGARGEAKTAQARRISAEALEDAVAFTPAVEAWPDLRRAFNEEIKAALLGDADVAEVLAGIESTWNSMLAARRPATMSAVPTPEAVGSDASVRGAR